MVKSFYTDTKKSGDNVEGTGNFRRVISGLSRPGNIDDDIVEDILDGTTVMNERAVVHVLTSWLRVALVSHDRRAGDGLEKRSEELKKTFGLDERDISLLIFLCCTYAINVEYLKEIQSEMTYSSYLRLASIATGLPLRTVHERLGSNGRLFKTGIIESMDTLRPEYFILNDNISDFLSGSSDYTLIEKCIRLDRRKVFDIDSYGIDKENVGIIRDILSAGSPVNILLHGTAGTGKTEFARSVAALTGKKVFFLNHRPESGTRKQGRGSDDPLLILNVAGNSVSADQGIIIVDEADYILNTGDRYSVFADTVEKGVLNNFLDRSKSQMIWITNRITNMEESTLRRFSYNLHFRAYSSRERENIWNAILAKHPLRKYIGKDLVRRLSLEYRVNAGSIASALDAAAMLFHGKKKSTGAVTNCMRRLLDRHQEMIHRDFRKRKKLHDLTDRYDVASLNTDTPPDQVIASVSGFAEMWKDSSETHDANLNLLFWGPPGTGKTEFVKYLAEKAGIRLVVHRYSDLESMWVGQSEKNIAAAFEEAEESKAILFIDEADSFFTSRASANRSWEVSRTNEFLTQMENHRGIFICCTNLLPSMDEAAMRRFHTKVRFDSLVDDGKERLFRTYFLGKNEKPDPELLKKVRAIEGLTPGDFKAVKQSMSFSKEKARSLEEIVTELEKEAGYRANKKRAVGF